ncbi:MAG: hypothetical protein IBX62_08655 [Coriobacteriia bacterium]|nr:hypothetical protein [Coriobacteriia bacterium]
MATIHLIEENEASAEVRQVYEDIKTHYGFGFVPNIFKALAHQPEILKLQWEGYKQAERTWGKEMVTLMSLAVDVTNGCRY